MLREKKVKPMICKHRLWSLEEIVKGNGPTQDYLGEEAKSHKID